MAFNLPFFIGLLVGVVLAAGLFAHWLSLRPPAQRRAAHRRMFGGITLRQSVAVLALSASGLVGLVVKEHYTNTAVIPTQGDRPTVGFGSTFHEDGRPVKMGDTTTPVRALIKAQAHISREEEAFRTSLPGVMLHQSEYDLYMDWVYQYGSGAWQQSTMRRELIAGNYVAACNGLLRYKFSAGYDCSTPGNKRCAGVWTRQLERHQKCMDAQS